MSAEPQVCSTRVAPICAPKCFGSEANAVDIVMRGLVLESPDFRYCELLYLRIKDRAVKDAINLSLARNRPDLSLGAMTDSSTSSFIDGSTRV